MISKLSFLLSKYSATSLRFTTLSAIVFVNLLFIIKYASWTSIPVVLFFLIYGLFIAGVVWFYPKILNRFIRYESVLFWAIVVFCTVLFLVIIHSVKMLDIPVDRASAITYWNDYLFKGIYPYLSRTHLNGRISGLPGLFFIAIPFQLIGDVGYLQVATFLLFAFLIRTSYKGIISHQILLLLLSSASFMFEIVAKSDLFSNMVFIIGIITFAEHIKRNKTNRHVIILACLTGVTCCTRGIIAIPVLLYFLRYFTKVEKKQACLFYSISIGVFSMLIVPFLVWDFRAFIENSPLVLQTNKTNPVFMVGILLLTLIAGLYKSSFRLTMVLSGIALFVLMAITFISIIHVEGVFRTLFLSKMDISYFTISLPYLLMGFDRRQNL